MRIEAIHTVKQLAHVGGHEMVLQMVAWQDPNAIAIKAFYEADVHVNFCGKLATDSVVQVSLQPSNCINTCGVINFALLSDCCIDAHVALVHAFVHQETPTCLM